MSDFDWAEGTMVIQENFIFIGPKTDEDKSTRLLQASYQRKRQGRVHR